jgi:subtilisin
VRILRHEQVVVESYGHHQEEAIMAANSEHRRYIIMPKQGFRNPALAAETFQPAGRAVTLTARAAAAGLGGPQMQVLDSIHVDGPKLVSMEPEAELSLRLSSPDVKIVPEVFYHRQWQRFRVHKRVAARAAKAKPPATGTVKAKSAKVAAARGARATGALQITVTDATSGNPLEGAHVVAFTDFASRAGADGKTGADGRLVLDGLTPSSKLDRFYLYAPTGFWGHFAAGTTGAKQSTIALDKIDIMQAGLLLPQFCAGLAATTGAGVTIAIVDTGVDATHPDLQNVIGGLNCVGDEVRDDPDAAKNWRPALVDGEHGTHVAGIAAGRGATSGFRGVAPGANLRAYRVFPDVGGGASNFDIAKGIDAAVADKCDIINLSLGGPAKDDLTQASIDRALAAGIVVIVAAGNDNRSPVSFPGALSESVAVSAMGRMGTFPDESIGSSDIATPHGGPGGKDFVADFSNIGPEIDVTGPGVEIVSTLPGGGYGSMSGTSMASPAVAGFTAHLLSTTLAVQQMQGTDRSRALKDLLYSKCKPEGFGREFEGFGLPQP